MKVPFIPAFQTLGDNLPITAKVIKLADVFFDAASMTHLARHQCRAVVHDDC